MNGTARAGILFVALSWSTVACSTTPSSALGAAPSVVCLTTMPSDFTAALAQGTVQLPGMAFSPQAVDAGHDVAFGTLQMTSELDVAALDLRTGRLRVLAAMPPPATGVSWMSFDDPWLAWEQTNSNDNLGNWSIEVLNTQIGLQRRLATSRLPDGTILTGQLAFPIVANGYVAWSQPTSAWSADLRLFRFDTASVETLDSGKLSSPVVAAGRLVWGKFGANQTLPSLRMADARTLQTVSIPPTLAGPMPIGYLAGSADYLVWTSGDSLAVERTATGAVQHYRFGSASLQHPFQFPMLARHFLVWFTGSSNTILDLRTGAAVDVALPSSVAAAGDEIVIARTAPGAKGAVTSTTVSWMRVTAASGLPSCSS